MTVADFASTPRSHLAQVIFPFSGVSFPFSWAWPLAVRKMAVAARSTIEAIIVRMGCPPMSGGRVADSIVGIFGKNLPKFPVGDKGIRGKRRNARRVAGVRLSFRVRRIHHH